MSKLGVYIIILEYKQVLSHPHKVQVFKFRQQLIGERVSANILRLAVNTRHIQTHTGKKYLGML